MNIPELTPELLEELSWEIAGCDFGHDSQKEFLSCVTSCDVQAAPGNGKTTLLAAKLALLSRTWQSRSSGICVISHTNAAREEIEKKLSSHPRAAAFLGYPHFVGTVTSFVDQFLALPFIRGLGWPLKRIDDDVFAAIALSRYGNLQALRGYANMRGGQNRRSLEAWVSQLELADDCDLAGFPQRLAVKVRERQPGPNTTTGGALQQLKSALVEAGYYRFGDMAVLANKALDACPGLVERVRERFPLVILDEAQDTNGAQLALLDRVFGQGVAYQRLGDQNQTLYEESSLAAEDYWRPGEHVIPLDETRRFGAPIAAFASRLTVRRPQEIIGRAETPDRRTLILFDLETIRQVLPKYAEECRTHWNGVPGPQRELWAVASRHNLYRDRRGEMPKSLVDYCPEYRSGSGTRSNPETFCAALRLASLRFTAHKSGREVMELINGAFVDVLQAYQYVDPLGRAITVRNVWRILASGEIDRSLAVRRLILDRALPGACLWDENGWADFREELKRVLGIEAETEPACMAFVGEGVVAAEHGGSGSNRIQVDGVDIRLGSIHSVKGRTADAILVVETEVFRGMGADQRTMDLAEILPHAFGIEDKDLSETPVKMAAATNIFVGITRPKEVLVLAMRKQRASEELIQAARAQGWNICDLTTAPAANEEA